MPSGIIKFQIIVYRATLLVPAFREVAIPITPRIALALNERIDGAQSVVVCPTKVQGLQNVIDENPDKVLLVGHLLSIRPP